MLPLHHLPRFSKSSEVTMSSAPAVTPERILQFAWGFAPPLILEAAIRHSVFDVLDEGPKTVQQLVVATGASERGLTSILNALVGLELLARDGAAYTLTPESAAFLVSSRPGYQGGFLRHTSVQLLPSWMQLNEIVATGKPAHHVNQQSDGTAFFQDFVADIFPLSYLPAQELAAHLNLGATAGPVSVLDLAAGSGVWSIALLQSAPNVHATAVDWPGVLPVTRNMVARFGLTDRYTYREGDLATADFGTGHHVATLGHILHSEGEAKSKALFARTFAALASGGTIAIQEFLVNAERTGPPIGVIFGVNMLVNTDVGDTYSFEEISAWLLDAGFVNPRTIPTHGPSPVILATKP